MKKGRKLLTTLSIISLLVWNMTVYAAEEQRECVAQSPGRQIHIEENVRNAAVTQDVMFGENNEIILSENSGLENVPMPMAVEGETCLITPHSETLWYGNWSTCKFTVNTSNGNYRGYCAQPQTPTPSGYYTVSKIDGSTELGKKLKIALMYGEDGPWYEQSPALFGGCSWSAVYGYLHAMIGVEYSGQTNGLTPIQVQAVQAALDGQYQERGHLPDLNNYTVYVAYNDLQDIIWLEAVTDIVPPGELKVKKASAITGISNNNGCYSLENAVYGVYKNSSCAESELVAEVTTNTAGETNSVSLDKGTYYVKEKTAPKGYALDKTVYTAEVTSGNTTTVSAFDIPQYNPVRILLEKMDAETNTNIPQGNASLKNAEFTVKYYAGYYDADPALNGITPVRSWSFRTDDEGKVMLNNKYKIAGDELYSVGDAFVLPLGTITVQETKAPEGYCMNKEVYIRQITPVGTVEKINTYKQVTVAEDILKIDITKTEMGTERVIPGTVFRHTMPNGTIEKITTDSNGNVTIKGLEYGIHTIEEISVLDGYVLNPGVLILEVTKENKIVQIKNTAEDLTGGMTLSVLENGCAVLSVEDVLAPYSVSLNKQNEMGKQLQGAEFTVYSDKECQEALKSGITDENGLLELYEFYVGTTYYIKETKAPQGYQIPVDEKGCEIVYEIRVESDPVNDTFRYFLNGEEQESSMIAGTKAERIVNLRVINYTGIKMPETGNPWTVTMALCGILSMMYGASLWNTNNKRGLI